MKVLRWVVLFGFCALASAEQVVDLYEAEPLVASQSERELEQAMGDGLAEVLVRASGQPDVLRNPEIVSALSRARDYMVQYGYTNSDKTLTVDGREVPAKRLQLRFSGTAVTNLLRDLNLPRWPANRPTTLVWLVADEVNEGRRQVSALSHPELVETLQVVARQRGLPIVTPLIDLEDQVAAPVERLWSLDERTIEQASQRYEADGVLVGRLSETSRRSWRANWYLRHRGQSHVFDSRGVDAQEALANGLAQLVDYYFGLYGIVPGSGPLEALTFQVNDVSDFAAYSRVLDYLNDLAVVRRAELVAVREDSLLFYLYPEGDLTLLQDALALDRKLVPQQTAAVNGALAAPPGSADNPLQYRWQ